MERTYFTAPPTARVEERTLALSGQLDPLYHAAERVLRCTAAAWALPVPAQLDSRNLERRAIASRFNCIPASALLR